MPTTIPGTRPAAARRGRIAVIGLFALAGIGGGYALASGSGGGSAPATQNYAPNGGSVSGRPQSEVAPQPALAAPPKK
jgi:hypothetical protein